MSGAFDFFNPDKAKGPRKGPDVGRDVTDDILAGDESSAGPESRDAGASDARVDGPSTGQPKAWSVSALVGRVKQALTDGLPERVVVVGEISNYKHHSSGHRYFRLKDASASIDAAMFKGPAGELKFTPADGLEVVVEGRVDVYAPRGQLQVYVERMTPRGQGALELAFRQLKEKLAAEGLFAAEHKKPLPPFPRAVGVVTSPTGAAVRDIRRTLARRWPGARVYLAPARVQGDRAAGEVAEAIAALDAAAAGLEIDVLIVARGGGSLEDLWAFNEEPVARAIFAARTPIIAGVGHESDVTIADLVADVRAPTPTGAAELAVPDTAEVAATLTGLQARLDRCVRQHLAASRAAVDGLARSVVFRDPAWRVREACQRTDELSHRLAGAISKEISQARGRVEPAAQRLAALHPARLAAQARGRLADAANRLRWALGGRAKRAGDDLAKWAGRLAEVHPKHRLAVARQRLDGLAGQLEALSYKSVLQRGYSVTRLADGTLVRSQEQVRPGDELRTELAEGSVRSRVGDGGADAPVAGQVQPAPKRVRRPKPKPRTDDPPGLFD